jgi:predicted AAA+ superfamily ATPase
LDLLSGAGLVCGLQKFAKQAVRQKGSSPKLSVYNTALMSAQAGKTFREAKKDTAFWGRLTESVVGAYLLNTVRGLPIDVFYWREGDKEVDFVLQHPKGLVAIEVKSSRGFANRSGMDRFLEDFSPARTLLIGEQGIPLEKFLTTPLTQFF